MNTLRILVRVVFETTSPSATCVQQNILGQIPRTLRTALERFHLEPRTTTFAACPRCHCVYDPHFDPQTGSMSYSQRCTKLLGPNGDVCGTDLLVDPPGEHAAPKLVRPFVVHSFSDYLSGLLSSAENVRHIEASCDDAFTAIHRNEAPPAVITHPHEAEYIRTFMIDKKCGLFFVDRGREIRLLFAIHVDSFNLEGMSVRGASTSSTIVSIACLNLPPELRYKPENIGLLCIIPGPKKPSLTALNNYLRPIIDVMLAAWERGIEHSHVATYEGSCVSRSAIALAIMDLVAARETAQLAAHNAHIYCHVCQCSDRSTRGRWDFENWKIRDVELMRQQAFRWRDAASEEEREKIFATHGVRWSEFWRLPYWDPTRQLAVDSMHCIFEGLIPYHFRTILGLTSANANLKGDVLPAFHYDFGNIDFEANHQLPSTQRLSDKELEQIPQIHRQLCLPLAGDVEAELAKLKKWLYGKNLKALRFVGDGLGLKRSEKMKKQDWADVLVTWVSLLLCLSLRIFTSLVAP